MKFRLIENIEEPNVEAKEVSVEVIEEAVDDTVTVSSTLVSSAKELKSKLDDFLLDADALKDRESIIDNEDLQCLHDASEAIESFIITANSAISKAWKNRKENK